jgi:hypothetical protein
MIESPRATTTWLPGDADVVGEPDAAACGALEVGWGAAVLEHPARASAAMIAATVAPVRRGIRELFT